jgi:hypothetical protein
VTQADRDASDGSLLRTVAQLNAAALVELTTREFDGF